MINGVKDVVNRVAGGLGFLADLVGLRLKKRLRMSVVILTDPATGGGVVPEADVEDSVAQAMEVFWKEAKTKIRRAQSRLVYTLLAPAPSAALEVGCGADAWTGDLGEAGDFFFKYSATNPSGFLIGYAAPVTVFIVKKVGGEGTGCSLGTFTNYVTVDPDGLKDPSRRILAHEMGHACGLFHRKKKRNLMYKRRDPGRRLRRWQESGFRNSRHVTYL